MNPATQTPTVTVEADPDVPMIRMTRDFAATPAQLLRAHTDPELFARWVGPSPDDEILEQDARSGRMLALRRDPREAYGFHGCFHEIETTGSSRPHLRRRPRQGGPVPPGVRGPGRRSDPAACPVAGGQPAATAWLASGMETGMEEGYAALDALLAALPDAASRRTKVALPADPAARHRVVAAGFGTVARGVADWGAPTPVAPWAARDVVAHLLDWFAGFLEAGTEVVLPRGRRHAEPGRRVGAPHGRGPGAARAARARVAAAPAGGGAARARLSTVLHRRRVHAHPGTSPRRRAWRTGRRRARGGPARRHAAAGRLTPLLGALRPGRPRAPRGRPGHTDGLRRPRPLPGGPLGGWE
ncbi:MAG: hypothetical protein R2731_05140 [Nocardioides sp.]